jgi:anti-sigma regulatory factor (Ser/Thr protein kinase)
LRAPLSADPREVAAARHQMAAHLQAQGINGEVADSAVLLVSELVTNAILHGEPPVELRVDTPQDHVHIEVHDGDREALVLLPRAAPLPHDRMGGRGLRLVQSLSSRWGLDEDDRGKCVWFEIDT